MQQSAPLRYMTHGLTLCGELSLPSVSSCYIPPVFFVGCVCISVFTLSFPISPSLLSKLACACVLDPHASVAPVRCAAHGTQHVLSGLLVAPLAILSLLPRVQSKRAPWMQLRVVTRTGRVVRRRTATIDLHRVLREHAPSDHCCDPHAAEDVRECTSSRGVVCEWCKQHRILSLE